jgi:glycosyltransferase involved in cell wall biosynthesis
MRPEVSIILPTYNRATTLRRALDSVRAQSMTSWELIVADDGSTDQTADVLKDWAHMGTERVLVLKSARSQGVSRARNRAAQQARGSWLAFLDSDDEWLPDKLRRQVDSRSALVHGEEIWIRDGRPVPVHSRYRKSGGRVFRRCVDLCFISPSATMIRRDLFEALGGFRQDFPVCEDYELWLKVSSRFDVDFIADPVVKKYAGHADQLSRRYPAMDYYRAKALLPYLNSKAITTEEWEHARTTLLQKCEILLNGFTKHGRSGPQVDEVKAWALKARTANHSAHSVALNLPRSESSLTL